MAIQTETVIHHHDGAELHGLLVFDDSATTPLPAVIISHAWAGRGENEVNKAHALAELGYAAFALDLYGEGKCGSTQFP